MEVADVSAKGGTGPGPELDRHRPPGEDRGDRGGDEDDGGGGCWTDLMGRDLIMRVEGDGGDDATGAGDAGEDAGSSPPEYGDGVRIDISGYVLGPDDLFSPPVGDGGEGDETSSASALEAFVGGSGHCFLHESDVLVTLGDGTDVPPGAEMGIRYLRPNASGVVRCMSKYAHGAKGLPPRKKDGGANTAAGEKKDVGDTDDGSYDVPPFTAVEFRIAVKQVIPPNEFTTELNTERALRKKAAGNDLFARGDLDRSLKLYLSAAKIASCLVDDLAPQGLDSEGEGTAAAEAAASASDAVGLLVDCRNNTALVHLKMGDHKRCRDACTEVLAVDPHNVKALCRAARASIELGEYGEAETCLDAAEESAGGDVAKYMDVRRVRAALKEARMEYLRKERERFEGKLVKGKGESSEKEKEKEKKKEGAATPKGFASAPLFVRISSLLVFFVAFIWAWWVRREEARLARADLQ